MCSVLEKEVKSDFNAMCLWTFEMLQKKLIEALILIVPDCELPLEVIFDVSDIVVGVVLGQRMSKLYALLMQARPLTLDIQIAEWLRTRC